MKRSLLSYAATLLAAVLLTAAITWQLARQSPPAPAGQASPAGGERKVLYWYDPMVPQQRFDQPGPSPFMDMELVPKYADEAASAGVAIDPQTAQNIGVRLAAVERVPARARMIATGVLGFDARAVQVEQARVAGFVERVWPLAPGDRVRAGQPLLELRAPDWAVAEREHVLLREIGDPALLRASEQRLRQLGLPAARLSALRQGAPASARFILHANTSGVVQSLDVRAGMALAPGQPLLTINGIERVWLEVLVPEAQAAGLAAGMAANAQLVAWPGERFVATVEQVLPQLADASRSLQLRLALDNADGRLRPGMSAQVELEAAAEDSVLAVPSEALIRSGRRSLLLLAGDAGRFQPVEVVVGRELGELTEIVRGVEAGQQVVASGQFLIDSEANLAGVLARSVVGADRHSGHPAEDGEPSAGDVTPGPELHVAEARVEAIEADRIRLAHGPFTSLGMPAMTMRFRLADSALVKQIAVGDRVRVWVRDGDSGLVVERLDKLGAQP